MLTSLFSLLSTGAISARCCTIHGHNIQLISLAKYILFWACRWIIDPPLDITVPAKRTPWPDAPPELPTSTEKVITIPETTEKRPPKRRKRSSRGKKKHSAKATLDERVSTKHGEDN